MNVASWNLKFYCSFRLYVWNNVNLRVLSADVLLRWTSGMEVLYIICKYYESIASSSVCFVGPECIYFADTPRCTFERCFGTVGKNFRCVVYEF